MNSQRFANKHRYGLCVIKDSYFESNNDFLMGQALHLSGSVDEAIAMYSRSLESGGPSSLNRNRLKTLEMIALIVEEMKHKELA